MQVLAGGAFCYERDTPVSFIRTWREVMRTPLGVRAGPLGPLAFEGAQHSQTFRPSVDGVRSKALRPFGSQYRKEERKGAHNLYTEWRETFPVREEKTTVIQ